MIPPTRRPPTALLVALLLALSLTPGAPALADCESSVAGCDPAGTRAERVRIRQVSATVPVPPAGRARYADLLPTGYQLPESPRVGVVVRQLEPVLPGLGTARTEAVVALRTSAVGEEGWFPLAVLTDSADAWAQGRDIGLPTVLADVAGVQVADGGADARVEVGGLPAVSLAAVEERTPIDAVDAGWALLSEPSFTQVPVFDGPERYRVKQTAKPLLPVMDAVPAIPLVSVPPVEGATTPVPARRAAVTVSVQPDLARLAASSPEALPHLAHGAWLAGLLDTARTVPGVVWDSEITLLSEAGSVHAGGGSGTPAVGLGAGVVAAGPLAQTVGFATPAAVVTQGGSLTFANLDQVSHDVTAVDRDGDGPLFEAELINFGQTAEVEGVADLPAGEYGFFCSLHPSMTGTLTVM